MALRRKDWAIAACFAVVLYGGIACYVMSPLLWSGRVTWPPVSDPSALLTGCAALLDHPGQVEDANWPASVKALAPVGVWACEDRVVITICTGGIGAAWGYLVYPDGRSDTAAPPGYIIYSPVSPGLFKYMTKE